MEEVRCKDCTEWCRDSQECVQWWGMSEEDTCPDARKKETL